MTPEEYLIKWKSPDWKFRNLVVNPIFLNINKIHPIKQKIVNEIVNEAADERDISRYKREK